MYSIIDEGDKCWEYQIDKEYVGQENESGLPGTCADAGYT